MDRSWYRILHLLHYALLQRNVRRAAAYCFGFIAINWLISINPFEIWQQNSRFELLQNEIVAFEKLSEKQAYLEKLVKNRPSDNQSDSDISEAISYQIYARDNYTLEYWTQATYVLNANMLENLQSLSYREIEKDKYLLLKTNFGDKCIVFWYDLNYFIDKQLNSSFHLFHSNTERKEYKAIGYKEKQSRDFVDIQGNFLFSLKREAHSNDLWIILGLLAIVFASFFYIKTLYFISKPITRLYSVLGCLFFASMIYLSRKVLLYYKIPSIFYTLKLFNPSLYSSDVTPSLGDLFLFVFSTQVILFYLQENLKIRFIKYHNTILAFIIHTVALIFLLGESFSINKIFERMVVESSIWFNFDFFPRLTIYSFIGLGIMLMSFSNYYLLSNLILKTISNFKLKRKKLILSFGILFLTVLGLILFTDIKLEVKLSFILLVFFIVLFYARYYFDIRNQVYSFAVFLIFASTTTTFLLSRYNIQKEEVILSSIATNVTFGLDKKLEDELSSALDKGLDSENFNKLAAKRGIDVNEIQQLEYQNLLETTYQQTARLVFSNDRYKVFFVNSSTVKFYLVEYNISNTVSYYTLHPRNHLHTIASSTKDAINDVIISENKISYGLFINNKLIDQFGIFKYQAILSETKSPNKILEELYGLIFEHTIFSYPNDVKVLVTTQKGNPVSILTQFSYVFCINFLLSLLLFLIAWSLKITYLSKPIFKFSELRSKIVLVVFLLIIGIFSGITFLSYNLLKTKFTNYNKEISYNNLKVTQQAIEQVFASKEKIPTEHLSDFFKTLRGVSSLHYDLYDDHGKLIQSSFTNVGALSYARLLNPQVIFEKIDKSINIPGLGVLESYTHLNKSDYPLSFYLRLFIPQNENSQNEELRFIVVLVNLYVLFFLISMIFAIWLANRITKPLQILTDKISKLGLNKKNEYLEYQYNDEIGELVRRYNIMVDKIQESAKLMAEQKQEEAWSEMAKQIAHEIKNPLTPMKLKIQFLQKKMKDGGGNIDALVASTADTLIEQINNLDSIATAFSNFGTLHTPHIESLDWKHLIENTVNVFQSRNCQILFNSLPSVAIVACDRNQMISCINNLVKNAAQAYDGEDAMVDVLLSENQIFFILEVKDYGKGIDPSQRDKIFAPNFTTKSSGSGLGLAIAKKIIQSMNGQIWFESTLGKGTSFYISLPKLIEKEREFKFEPLELEWKEKGFQCIQDQNILIDLAYAKKNNIFNAVLYQDFNHAFVHEITYYKLLKASELLLARHSNLRIVIKDALRPFEVQKKMWDIYEGENKINFIAPPDRDSMHNYGMAVDVWLIEIVDDAYTPNKYLDMGCDFDEFSERAHFDFIDLSPIQKSNRMLLREIMTQAGFIAYEHEFWHFEAMHIDWVRENCIRV